MTEAYKQTQYIVRDCNGHTVGGANVLDKCYELIDAYELDTWYILERQDDGNLCVIEQNTAR